MAVSTATKTTLETRMKALLSASAPATLWVVGALDEALTMTLEEYSRARPYVLVVSQVPTAREFAVAGGVALAVSKVWFPYTAATPEYPPAFVDFDFWWDTGSPKVLLHTPAVPDGVQVARLWLRALHLI
jgi:hypothetical protein